jgi:hypothetical protein
MYLTLGSYSCKLYTVSRVCVFEKTSERCDWEFLITGTLEAHIRTHDGIRPFSCTQCDKSFYVKRKFENSINNPIIFFSKYWNLFFK